MSPACLSLFFCFIQNVKVLLVVVAPSQEGEEVWRVTLRGFLSRDICLSLDGAGGSRGAADSSSALLFIRTGVDDIDRSELANGTQPREWGLACV